MTTGGYMIPYLNVKQLSLNRKEREKLSVKLIKNWSRSIVYSYFLQRMKDDYKKKYS